MSAGQRRGCQGPGVSFKACLPKVNGQRGSAGLGPTRPSGSVTAKLGIGSGQLFENTVVDCPVIKAEEKVCGGKGQRRNSAREQRRQPGAGRRSRTGSETPARPRSVLFSSYHVSLLPSLVGIAAQPRSFLLCQQRTLPWSVGKGLTWVA